MVEINFSASIIGSIIKSIWNLIPTIKNYLLRPKANIQIKHNIIEIEEQSKTHHINYPCIMISFKRDTKIDVSSIKLNNQTLHGMLSRDPNFLNQNPSSKNPITVKNNRIMPFISDNWLELNQKPCHFDFKKLEQEAFPLFVKKEMSHFLFNPKNKSRLFRPKTKLTLSLNIEGQEYEYGIQLIDACKVIINNLAFK